MTLRELKIGQWGKVLQVGGDGHGRQHFLDMGITLGAYIQMVKYAPMGDPVELRIHGYSLTLRLADAEKIEIEPVKDPSPDKAETTSKTTYASPDLRVAETLHEHNSHPGFGEEGKYHDSTHEQALPKDTLLTFALVGQQNCGKSTLFNQLTGEKQHVSNFPGVTLEKKDGTILGRDHTLVTDLPGLYSLSPYTSGEEMSRQFILNEKPRCIINVVDASNIERHLYLTMQLMELDIPVVLALNMMDELRNNGGSIRVNEMEKILGIPVVPISAAENEGIDELVEHAIHVARYKETPARQDFCDKDDHGGAVHRCLHSIMHLVEDHAEKAKLPVRFVASKLVEGDHQILEQLHLSQNEKEMLEHIILQMEEERGIDRAAAMADMRYAFIKKLSDKAIVKPNESHEYRRSKKIDQILTGKWTAIPIFIITLCLIIWLSIDVLGSPLQNWLAIGIQGLSEICGNALANWGTSETLISLVTDGIFGGVGCVLSFIPIIILLFFFLSLLEDSGYMSRVAFVTDKLLRRFGLSGRSIVPLLIGFGCSVPAVMAARTLPSARDRRLTILLTPFMSCSAKIPVYAFFTSYFFPNHGGLVLISLYLLGIFTGLLIAWLKKTFSSKSAISPFVMEMPNYRLPRFKNVLHLLWSKTKDFLQNAFTVIFFASLVIWALQTFDFTFHVVENGEGSMLACIAGFIAPIFKPMGLGDWRIVTSLVSGLMAKESVVATLEVLGGASIFTTRTAIPMLVFCLLYTPCVATITAIKRELGAKWAFGVVLFQCSIAWIFSWIAFLIASLII